jgi:predicted extracellular nuclease
MLLNHFKSKGYGNQADNDAKRKRQAGRVREILKGYNLKKDLVVVCGDFNDTPDSQPIAPLHNVADLHDALALEFPNASDRWTYHYKKNEQIDYLLISAALKKAFLRAGVERRGIYDVEKYTNGATKSFSSVTRAEDAASDHAAVCRIN